MLVPWDKSKRLPSVSEVVNTKVLTTYTTTQDATKDFTRITVIVGSNSKTKGT